MEGKLEDGRTSITVFCQEFMLYSGCPLFRMRLEADITRRETHTLGTGLATFTTVIAPLLAFGDFKRSPLHRPESTIPSLNDEMPLEIRGSELLSNLNG